MLSAIINNSGTVVTNISATISGGGTISVRPATVLPPYLATSIKTVAVGGAQAVVTISFNINEITYSLVLNGGLPIPDNQYGLLIIEADGRLVELNGIF
ncbi:MAG: hypothetical protein HYX66_08090 [Ignavibacteria bacterium]|nr:hypothetical protein [Ignavibacteria bacterium]